MGCILGACSEKKRRGCSFFRVLAPSAAGVPALWGSCSCTWRKMLWTAQMQLAAQPDAMVKAAQGAAARQMRCRAHHTSAGRTCCGCARVGSVEGMRAYGFAKSGRRASEGHTRARRRRAGALSAAGAENALEANEAHAVLTAQQGSRPRRLSRCTQSWTICTAANAAVEGAAYGAVRRVRETEASA